MADLPSGTVTFLLTDIQGSTALWERDPGAMERAMVRHDALVTTNVEGRGGSIIRTKGEGDSAFAVFARASDALAAALDIQRALQAEPWPTDAPLRVRIALHTGEADLRDGDYYGSAVNRCARLRGLAYGGQVLLSQATHDLVRDALPDGVVLLDLGEHRLRDLARPERVYQPVHPALPSDFPPLRSLDARTRNLPSQPTALLGRERDVVTLVERLSHSEARLVTLTGPGGTGKTRLALQVADDLRARFPDGVYLVALASITDPGLVGPAVAQAIGVRDTGGRPLLDVLRAYLCDRSLLLVLDNFEQVLAAAPTVADLLAAGPCVRILATSREALRVRGEQEVAVPPLITPDPRQTASLDALARNPAVALFVERAGAVRSDFMLTDENAGAVAGICIRLDGLPLAIELAAARVRALAPDAILARLDRRLPLLVGGPRDAPARQRTLRDTIAWSYDLLDEAERRLFRRLAVFVGGWSLEAAEAVCGAAVAPGMDVLDGLASLIAKSLVHRVDGVGREPRFGMLETIREYGLEQLAAAEGAALRALHASYYLALAEAAEWGLRSSDQGEWLTRLERDHDNLRAALAWTRGQPDPVEAELRLASALHWFWYLHGHLSEGRAWLGGALARGAAAGRTAARARALGAAGTLAWHQSDLVSARALLEESVTLGRQLGDDGIAAYALLHLVATTRDQGDLATARTLGEESVALWRDLGDTWGEAYALLWLGLVVRDQGDLARARALEEGSVRLARQVGEPRLLAASRLCLGSVLMGQGDHETAGAYLQQALAMLRQIGDLFALAQALNGLGDVARGRGDDLEAAARYEESLALWERLGYRGGVASVLHNLGYVAHHRGDDHLAAQRFAESLALFRDLGDRRAIAECLVGAAGTLGAAGEPLCAARLIGAAEALLEAIGAAISPSNVAEYHRTVTTTCAVLGEEGLAAARAEGRVMGLKQAVGHVLGAAGSSGS
jgi:predicted ATPase/class 3 adenylate cyclase